MQEDYGPRGDADRHLTLAELRAGLDALPPAPRDRGRVALLVARRSDGVRVCHERVVLSPDRGMPGDRWERGGRNPSTQLAVMRRDVAEVIAGGQPIEIAGDNLFVDLDLSAENLPAGSRLRVGRAVVEVSPVPHNGCLKFRERFGPDALEFTADPTLRSRHLRGVYRTFVEAGEFAVGGEIVLLDRHS